MAVGGVVRPLAAGSERVLRDGVCVQTQHRGECARWELSGEVGDGGQSQGLRTDTDATQPVTERRRREWYVSTVTGEEPCLRYLLGGSCASWSG